MMWSYLPDVQCIVHCILVMTTCILEMLCHDNVKILTGVPHKIKAISSFDSANIWNINY